MPNQVRSLCSVTSIILSAAHREYKHSLTPYRRQSGPVVTRFTDNRTRVRDLPVLVARYAEVAILRSQLTAFDCKTSGEVA